MNLASLVHNWWMIGAGTRSSTRIFDAWPVLLEGTVSVGLGLLALALFLAILVLLLPHADDDFIMRVMAAYAQVFGAVLLFAAIFFPREVLPASAPPDATLRVPDRP